MSRSEAYQKGMEIRQELMGDAMANEMANTVYDDPIMEKFGEYTREAVFGLLWSRPGLDMKTRALICCITDTATGRWPELEIHLQMARRQGWTEDELAAALLHTGGYIGVPAVREAMLIAKEVFAKMREDGRD